MRLIDADALIPMIKNATIDSVIGIFPILIGFNDIVQVIDEQPIVDAVPVVRCKDCKHWVSNWEGCRRNPSVEHWREEDFCNYGERGEAND